MNQIKVTISYVGYNKYIVTVIIDNKKLDVKYKPRKKLELSKIYKYTFEMISGRLCCKKFVLFRSKKIKD